MNGAGNVILVPTAGKVGIGTTVPANTLEIVAGGTTLADAWTTRSSLRFKTNIQPLQGALEKVEQLRGVSYDLETNGKHEVGVIAEEVGAVVPEVVSWDKNGKDATARLFAIQAFFELLVAAGVTWLLTSLFKHAPLVPAFVAASAFYVVLGLISRFVAPRLLFTREERGVPKRSSPGAERLGPLS